MNSCSYNYLIKNFNTIDRKKFPGSMSPIEILIFIFLCCQNKIEVVIESGRQYGYSTFFISLFCKKNKIKFISIDNELDPKINDFARKLLKNNRVIYETNNFFKSIDKIFDENKKRRIALLIDGPKGMMVHIKSFFLAKKFNNLIFTFFDNIPNSYLSSKILFMYSKVFSFHKIYIKNDLKKISSVDNFQIKTFNKIKFFNKFIKDFLKKKDDIDFAYVYAKNIKKSILIYIIIFFLLLKNMLCRILIKLVKSFLIIRDLLLRLTKKRC